MLPTLRVISAAFLIDLPASNAFTTFVCFASSAAPSKPVPSGLPSLTPFHRASANPLLMRSSRLSVSLNAARGFGPAEVVHLTRRLLTSRFGYE